MCSVTELICLINNVMMAVPTHNFHYSYCLIIKEAQYITNNSFIVDTKLCYYQEDFSWNCGTTISNHLIQWYLIKQSQLVLDLNVKSL